MANLIYTAIGSLDGYLADEDGRFDWAEPDEEVHAFVNDMERPVGTYLLGRRVYELMTVWETADGPEFDTPVMRDFAGIWRAADKVVYSRTLASPSTPRTRLEREFDPAAVRALKAEASADLSIGGAELAAAAIRAGLVDEYQLYVVPWIIGGGKRILPDGVRFELELTAERRFRSGVVYLRYRAGR